MPRIVDAKTNAAYLYMYTTDSPFNMVSINQYMSDGTPVIPIDVDLLGSLSNSSSLSDYSNAFELLQNRSSKA